jgi:hypothetical protein
MPEEALFPSKYSEGQSSTLALRSLSKQPARLYSIETGYDLRS